ncbi:hypothetical protein Baya_16418 [Bagarius yarrelli]|uniref:Uncharacterized protein n=1 Tax=Bagarius yarrelli TaxID=175774 RepID=A0A556VVU6_BAGYA|nr:hypothetical protein Baya_16418 [Bagarius yarrelli]
MDSESVMELKSWVSRKLWDLKREMKIETQRKMADLSKELASCFRLQREQMFTLLQMQTNTRETAIENLLSKHTSEPGGEQHLKPDRKETAEDKNTEEDKALLLSEKKTKKEERQSARKKINQEMDSISKLRTEEDEIKRKKEREKTVQKKEKEEMKERKTILKDRMEEDIIKQLEEETRKKDESQREIERKRSERRQNNSSENINEEIESETGRWESETDPEEEETSQVSAAQRQTPSVPTSRIKLQEESINMPERKEEREEEKKTHMARLGRMMKLMRTTSHRVLSLQCRENTSKEVKRQRNLEKKRKQEEQKKELEEMRKEEKQKNAKKKEQKERQRKLKKRTEKKRKRRKEEELQRKLEKRRVDEERLKEVKEKRKLEKWKKELEEKMKEEEGERWQRDSSEDVAVEMNSGSDGWESETDSEEEVYNGGPAAQSRTPSRRSVTFKIPEENEKIHKCEKGSEEDVTQMSGLGRVMKLMRTTSQKVLSLQSGRSNFEETREQCVYRPPKTSAKTSLQHTHVSSRHLRGVLPPVPELSRSLKPGPACLHPHSAGKRYDSDWTYFGDQTKPAKRRSHPPLTPVSSDLITSGRSKHSVYTSHPKFTDRRGADLKLFV